ncbi:ABC transporter ATP-binding protein [Cellulomonas cellasea]|uniref:Multidrug ABC transporter permease n=1 Tax=Cellulomonas cellasea TaxID=43670 RepID=A0A4Y3L191_9CELL|nr:ATP-binding cassette domain-containing protein [Cellulomonas cellasea]GEA88890.1 multidrug ABC transporter permease [Cellulomonas cellasea]
MQKTVRRLCAATRERTALLALLPGAGRPLLAVLVAVRVLQALLPAATALVTARLLDAAATPGAGTAGAVLLVGAVLLLGQTCSVFQRPLVTLVRGRIDARHRADVMRLLTRTATLDVVESAEVQALVRAATADPREWVEKTPAEGALGQLSVLVRWVGLVSTAAVVAAWSWWLVPLLVVPAVVVRHLVRGQWVRHFRIWVDGLPENRRAHYWGELTSAPAEAKELRTFGLGAWVVDRRQRHLHAQLDDVWADDLRAAREKWWVLLAAVVPLGAAFVVAAVGTTRGHGTVGALAGLLAAGWGVFSAVTGTGDALMVEGARPVVRAAEALRARLTEPETETVPGAVREIETETRHVPGTATAPEPAAPHVRLEGVTFAYPGSSGPVLRGLDLEIRPGELLAVVGLNGAGKSTLTKVLAGLYEPSAGRVTADGVDVRAIGARAWRRRVTVVHQDFVRYQLSLEDNIALGQVGGDRPWPDPDAVRGAATDAGLGPVVDGLPAGWRTPLARSRTGGVDLSGGQWQQVALARALYATRAGARVLVLDEPTAHLDVRTEAELFRRLAGITQGVSTVLVSHRLSTVRLADRIVLLADGRIAESGTHDELMALGGSYAHMFALQAQRFARGYDDRLETGVLS